MMEVDAVIFPRMDEEFVTDLNLSDSEDEGDPNNVMEMTEKESNYGSVTGDINLGRQHHDAPEETGLTKEKKMDILRKLMKEVNLEDTLEKYRGFKESHVQGNNRSLGNGEVPKKRSRMGSDVLLWADRQYMSSLEDQMERQYQTNMDKKEEERADLERQRVRRLMVEGILCPEDMSEGYSRDKDSNPSKGQAHFSRQRKGTASSDKSVRSPRRSAWRSQSAPERNTRYQSTPQPSSKSPRPSQNSSNKTLAFDQRKSKSAAAKPATPRYYTESTFSVDTQVARLSRNEYDDDDDSNTNSSQRCYVHDQVGCACDSQKPTKRQSFTKRYVDPQVILLEKEQSVEGMYSLAEEILPENRPKPHLEDPEEARERKMNAAAERKRRDLALAGRIPRR